jgi:hypothetical protein
VTGCRWDLWTEVDAEHEARLKEEAAEATAVSNAIFYFQLFLLQNKGFLLMSRYYAKARVKFLFSW